MREREVVPKKQPTRVAAGAFTFSVNVRAVFGGLTAEEGDLGDVRGRNVAEPPRCGYAPDHQVLANLDEALDVALGGTSVADV